MELNSRTEIAPELDNTGLVKRAVNGEAEAYGELYSLHLDRIYRYVFYLVGNNMMAEDITEEVFIKAWKSIKTCQGKELTFLPWLYRIAHNHAVDSLRKIPKNIPLEFGCTDTSHDVEQQAETSLEFQRVLKFVAELPEQQRQIIILKFLNGFDNDEIEKITKKRQGAIRALQMRALNSLKQRLNAEVRGYGA